MRFHPIRPRTRAAAGPAASAALAASILALCGVASAAAALPAGSYSLQGVQRICLRANGTWYGESFGPWSGRYGAGPTGQIALFGNYKGGRGNDSIVIRNGSSQWTEWTDSLSFSKFLVGAFTRVKATCAPPAVEAAPGHDDPMD